MSSAKISLRNGPSSYSPSKKCPLLSKCPFNKLEIMINYNVNSQVKESYNESDRIQPADQNRWDSGLWTDIRIPSVGIRWDPSVGIWRNLLAGLDRPLLLISSFNKLVPGANFRGPSKPTDRFRWISTLGSYPIPILGIRMSAHNPESDRISSVIGIHI
jgi:hypothetical protein